MDISGANVDFYLTFGKCEHSLTFDSASLMNRTSKKVLNKFDFAFVVVRWISVYPP